MNSLQGGSRRTWSYGSHGGQPEQIYVEIGSDGRPVDAEFELWQGPGNTPVQTRVHGDDGYARPVHATVGTGRGAYTSTASVRNTGPLEFPINANFGASYPSPSAYRRGVVQPTAGAKRGAQRIQGGGALRTFTLDGSVGSVQVDLESEGMPIYAMIEILQGPNSDRQSIDLYSDDGRGKPVSYLLELPGYGSTISITNTGPIEYPLTASVAPYGPQRIENLQDERNRAGAYGGTMQGGGGGARYGPGDRYGRDGGLRRVSEAEREAATGRKWYEKAQRGGAGPRGPPPSFEDVQDGYYAPAAAGVGYGARGYGAPPPRRRAYAGVSDGARYGRW